MNIKEKRQLISKLETVFGNVCWYCGRSIRKQGFMSHRKKYRNTREYNDHSKGAIMEHIIPKSKGGEDKLYNLALSCEICNRAKLDLNVDIFLKWLSYLRSSQFSCKILGKLPKNIINNLDKIEWDRLRKDFFGT